MKTIARTCHGVVLLALLAATVSPLSAQALDELGDDLLKGDTPNEVAGEMRYHKLWTNNIWAGEVAQLFGGDVLELRMVFGTFGAGAGGGYGGGGYGGGGYGGGGYGGGGYGGFGGGGYGGGGYGGGGYGGGGYGGGGGFGF